MLNTSILVSLFSSSRFVLLEDVEALVIAFLPPFPYGVDLASSFLQADEVYIFSKTRIYEV